MVFSTLFFVFLFFVLSYAAQAVFPDAVGPSTDTVLIFSMSASALCRILPRL